MPPLISFEMRVESSLTSFSRDTCPLPLLDHWRETVLDLLQSREMLARLPFALGPLEGHRLAIDVPALTLALGSLIRSDVLTLLPFLAPWSIADLRRSDKSAQPWRCRCRIFSGLVDTASDLARMAHLFPSGGFGAMYGEGVLRASFHAGWPTL